MAWLFPALLASAQVNDDPAICAGAEQRFQERRARAGRDEMVRMAAALRDRCPQLAARILASLPPPSGGPQPRPPQRQQTQRPRPQLPTPRAAPQSPNRVPEGTASSSTPHKYDL